jgi:hypothetical protein
VFEWLAVFAVLGYVQREVVSSWYPQLLQAGACQVDICSAVALYDWLLESHGMLGFVQ